MKPKISQRCWRVLFGSSFAVIHWHVQKKVGSKGDTQFRKTKRMVENTQWWSQETLGL